MARALVDTNVLLAGRLERDVNHEPARSMLEGVDRGELPTGRIVDPVLHETLDYLNERASPDAAIATLDALVESDGFEFARPTCPDLDAGRSLFRQRDPLSLTDAVVAAHARRTDLEYVYSFDDGSDGVDGTVRLTSPVNPYR